MGTTPFETFVEAELPNRQVLMKDSGSPIVNGVPGFQGAEYLDTNTDLKYYHDGTSWGLVSHKTPGQELGILFKKNGVVANTAPEFVPPLEYQTGSITVTAGETIRFNVYNYGTDPDTTDSATLYEVRMPDGTVYTFDNGIPAAFTEGPTSWVDNGDGTITSATPLALDDTAWIEVTSVDAGTVEFDATWQLTSGDTYFHINNYTWFRDTPVVLEQPQNPGSRLLWENDGRLSHKTWGVDETHLTQLDPGEAFSLFDTSLDMDVTSNVSVSDFRGRSLDLSLAGVPSPRPEMPFKITGDRVSVDVYDVEGRPEYVGRETIVNTRYGDFFRLTGHHIVTHSDDPQATSNTTHPDVTESEGLYVETAHQTWPVVYDYSSIRVEPQIGSSVNSFRGLQINGNVNSNFTSYGVYINGLWTADENYAIYDDANLESYLHKLRLGGSQNQDGTILKVRQYGTESTIARFADNNENPLLDINETYVDSQLPLSVGPVAGVPTSTFRVQQTSAEPIAQFSDSSGNLVFEVTDTGVDFRGENDTTESSFDRISVTQGRTVNDMQLTEDPSDLIRFYDSADVNQLSRFYWDPTGNLRWIVAKGDIYIHPEGGTGNGTVFLQTDLQVGDPNNPDSGGEIRHTGRINAKYNPSAGEPAVWLGTSFDGDNTYNPTSLDYLAINPPVGTSFDNFIRFRSDDEDRFIVRQDGSMSLKGPGTNQNMGLVPGWQKHPGNNGFTIKGPHLRPLMLHTYQSAIGVTGSRVDAFAQQVRFFDWDENLIARFHETGGTTLSRSLTVEEASGQTDPLIQANDSAGNPLYTFNVGGNFTVESGDIILKQSNTTIERLGSGPRLQVTGWEAVNLRAKSNGGYTYEFANNGAVFPASLSLTNGTENYTFGLDNGDLVLTDQNGLELIRQPEGAPTQFIQGIDVGFPFDLPLENAADIDSLFAGLGSLQNELRYAQIDAKTSDYTIRTTDAGRILHVDTTSNDVVITLPSSISQSILVTVKNIGTGVVTLSPEASGTLNVPGGRNQIVEQYGGATVYYEDVDTWYAEGRLA